MDIASNVGEDVPRVLDASRFANARKTEVCSELFFRSRRSQCMHIKDTAECLQIQMLCSAIQDSANKNKFGFHALPRHLRR